MTLTVTPAPVQPPTFTPPPVSITLNAGGTVIDTLGTVQPAAVQPAAIQPPAIVVTDAQMAAALQADGYTVTAPGVVVTPPPPPPPPPAGAWGGYIVKAGVLDPYWGGSPAPANQLAGASGGNWDSSCTQAQTAAGIVYTPNGSFMEAIQHPQGVAGNPSQNGIAIALVNPVTGQLYTEYSVTLTPSAEIGQLSMFLCGVAGFGSFVGANPPVTVTDAPLQAAITIGNNIPAGVPTTLTVPLSSLGFPNKAAPEAPFTPAPNYIYKRSWQVNAPTAGVTILVTDEHFS